MLKQIFKVMFVVTAISLMVYPALSTIAFDARSGKTIIINSDEVVNDDLYLTANTILVDGTINGDLTTFGRSVSIKGVVKGGVLAAGETVKIGGEVSRAVRAAGRNLIVDGNFDGDVLLAGDKIHINDQTQITGSLVFAGRNISVDGSVKDGIKGYGQEVIIDSQIKGDVELEVEELVVLPRTRIDGDLIYGSDQDADIQSGAQISGMITRNPPSPDRERLPSWRSISTGIGFVAFFMSLLTGLIIVLLAPKWLESTTDYIIAKPGPSVGWGAVILFATPVAALIAFIIVIGIPVSLITLALYAIAIYISQIPVCLLIGRWIISRFRSVEGKAIMFGALALGLFIYRILRMIPFLGGLIVLAAILFGLGAMAVSIKNRSAYRQEATISPEEPNSV
jgi:cytoskeletal protein CcmA (bactofilin family)